MANLIINADDFGYTDGVCRAIVELFDMDAISSTTFMAASVGGPQRAQRWHLRRYCGKVGVHLQLTGGRPLCPTQRVPSLINAATGLFGAKDRLQLTRPDEVREEWKRQIEVTAEILGETPSHLDSHHGVHRMPHLFETYLSLAQLYRIPVRSGNFDLEELMPSHNVKGPDLTVREWTGRSLGVEGIKDILTKTVEGQPSPRTIELVSHPGYCDAELMSTSSLNTAREDDRRSLEALARENWPRQVGFNLVSYSSFDGK